MNSMNSGTRKKERVAACRAEQTKAKGGIHKKQKQQKEWNDRYHNSANTQQKQARRKKDRQRKKKAKLVSESIVSPLKTKKNKVRKSSADGEQPELHDPPELPAATMTTPSPSAPSTASISSNSSLLL